MMHLNTPIALPPDLQHAMQMALAYHKGGRTAEAAALYGQLLTRYPKHPDLLGQLGALQMEQRDFQAALPLLEHARRSAPGNAQHWLMLTRCLLELDRAKDAKKVISEAIGKGLRHPLADELLRQARAGKKKRSEKPVPLNETLRQLDALLRAGRYPEAERLGQELQGHHAKSAQLGYLLGMAALLQGRPQDAAPLFGRAVKLDPGMAPAQYNLGFALESLGRLDEALGAYRNAVAAAPQLADAHNNLGNVLQKLERPDEALAAYERALALRPEAAEFHMNRGDALRELGRQGEAVVAYETALKHKPALVEVYVNLALALYQLGRYEESVRVCRRAIEQRPGSFEAYQGMGLALSRLGRDEEAVEAYRRAAELKPDDAEAHKVLGLALKDLGCYEEALTSLQQALALKPDLGVNALAGLLLDMGRHAEALETYRRGLALKPEGYFIAHSNLLLALNYQTGATPDMLVAEARSFGEKAASKAVPFAHHGHSSDPDRRLRIGLVSGDLGLHPVGFFLQNVLESLDPNRLEVFAYATTERKDALNERLRRSIPHWREASVSRMSDEELANTIRDDGIDILIDLAGHTGNNRLPVFAWKPAPVQVSWLGYLGTTGLSAMDYILADARALPVGEEAHFTETPWRLPDTYICFSPPDLPVRVEPLPALDRGGITFGCFNNLNKITDEVVACWARVLQAVPDGRLYLKNKSLGYPEARIGVEANFARFGIGSERLILEGQFASHEEHFQAYHKVDIALDPFPYPGITTTVEALWMGVPVVAMKGERFISHQAETILHNVGLPEWIADDADDYVAKAAAFAGNVEALSGLRAGLRERLLGSPLCDAPRFARNLEAAFTGMWQRWCAGQKRPATAN